MCLDAAVFVAPIDRWTGFRRPGKNESAAPTRFGREIGGSDSWMGKVRPERRRLLGAERLTG